MGLLVQMSRERMQAEYLMCEAMLIQLLDGGAARFMEHLQARYLKRREQWCRAWRTLPDTCTCEDYRFSTHACKHIHAVHGIYYTIPAAKGEESSAWLTGTVTDVVVEPDGDDELPAEGLTAETVAELEMPAVVDEEPVVEELAAGPSTPSLYDRARASLENISKMHKYCDRLVDMPFEEHVEMLETFETHGKDMFKKLGVNFGVTSCPGGRPDVPQAQASDRAALAQHGPRPHGHESEEGEEGPQLLNRANLVNLPEKLIVQVFK